MSIRIPAEWEPYDCCWTAWSVHREWDKATISKIKRDLSKVVQTIARYEPVRVLAARGAALREAQQAFAACRSVTVIEAPVDDFWMRDIMPSFAIRSQEGVRKIVAIDWNFNGWGGTQERPPRDGDRLAKRAASLFGVPRVEAGFTAEGGALITDGCGTMITTRSCLLNPNRNPVKRGVDRQRMIEGELEKLGIQKVIWLEGDPCEPITSGHTDGYVLCAPRGIVLVEAIDDEDFKPPLWREHDIVLLENACDAIGRKLKVRRVLSARRRYWKGDPEFFAASYLNAYVANGAVIAAKFGDRERDAAARSTLAKAFPGYDIVMLEINALANAGGGVHCVTQGVVQISRQ
jgi:agmatine deiminase